MLIYINFFLITYYLLVNLVVNNHTQLWETIKSINRWNLHGYNRNFLYLDFNLNIYSVKWIWYILLLLGI